MIRHLDGLFWQFPSVYADVPLLRITIRRSHHDGMRVGTALVIHVRNLTKLLGRYVISTLRVSDHDAYRCIRDFRVCDERIQSYMCTFITEPLRVQIISYYPQYYSGRYIVIRYWKNDTTCQAFDVQYLRRLFTGGPGRIDMIWHWNGVFDERFCSNCEDLTCAEQTARKYFDEFFESHQHFRPIIIRDGYLTSYPL